MSRGINVQQMFHELEEMFPNHSSNLIQNAMAESRGNINVAINKLLAIPPDKTGSRKSSHSHRTSKPNSLPPTQTAQSNLIFGDDFLKWPNDVKYIKIFRDDGIGSLLDDQGPSNSTSCDNLDLLSLTSGNIPTEALSDVEYKKRTQANKNGWETLRNRLAN